MTLCAFVSVESVLSRPERDPANDVLRRVASSARVLISEWYGDARALFEHDESRLIGSCNLVSRIEDYANWMLSENGNNNGENIIIDLERMSTDFIREIPSSFLRHILFYVLSNSDLGSLRCTL